MTETRMKTIPYEPILIRLMLFMFGILALGFSLGPIFEGPDESAHYNFVRYLQANRQLPDPTGDPHGQFHQAPLYYALMQPLAWLVPDPDFDRRALLENPNHAYDIARPGNDNKNLYLHTRQEAFPYPDPTARAVHLMRLTSVMMGLLTVWLLYRITLSIWPEYPYRRLLAVGIVGFWPQFLYISSVLNNDNLLVLLSTLALLTMLHQQQNPTWRKAIILGVVCGAVLLTKTTAAMLAIPIGLVTLLNTRLWKYAVLTVIIALVIAGWWYARNWLNYGDLLGVKAMFVAWPNLAVNPDGSMNLRVGLESAPYAYGNVWARFGQGAVSMQGWIYRVFDLLMVMAAVGLVIRSVRWWREQHASKAHIRQGVFIVAFALVWIVAIISASSVASAGNQGRYLFPGIAAWAMVLSIGLDSWMPDILRRYMTALVIILLGFTSVSALVWNFYPAYRTPPVPDEIPRLIEIHYEDTAELVGMRPAELSAKPGETLTIELYWRVLAPASPTLQTYLHAIEGEAVLWRDTIPGNGNRPAHDWQPGDMWTDRYVVRLPDNTDLKAEYILVAGLFDPATGQALEAFDPAGNSLSNTPGIATLRIGE